MYVDPITKRFCKGNPPIPNGTASPNYGVASAVTLPANTRRPRLTTSELGAAVDEAERAVEDARERLDAAERDLSNAEQALHVAREAMCARVKL